MLEKMIIDYCAPTLAKIKTANLFNYKYSSRSELETEIADVNEKLNVKGVSVEVLKITESRALIYVYRKQMLEADFLQKGVSALLKQCGYTTLHISESLEILKMRLMESECFPHEIGLFLGYPLEDVLGFIKHSGRNYKHCGIWKVYSNEYEARKLFAKFHKCTEVYSRVFAGGRTITQMTVAA